MNQPEIKDALQKGIRAARRGRKEPAQQLLGQVVQADPMNEEAWLWLSRVVDLPADKAACFNRILEINPNNQWAAEQLAALQATPAASTSTAPTAPPSMMAESDIELEVLQCPNCKAPLDIQGGSEVKAFVCNSCDSIVDLTAEQAAILGQSNAEIQPAVPLELGMEGRFQGKLHQIIGWIRYQGWDDEERWTWDEWLLLSEAGEFRWLSYDVEGFVFYKRIELTDVFDPRTATTIPLRGGDAQIVERAPAKVFALKGELTWRAKIGEQITYLDAKRGDAMYSVEYTNEEIEVLSGRPLAAAKVWRAFGMTSLATEAETRAEADRIQWGEIYRWAAIYCFVLIMLGIAAIAYASVAGSRVYQGQTTLAPGESGAQTLGPILLNNSRTHRITLKLEEFTTSSVVRVGVSMVDSQNRSFNIGTQQFRGSTTPTASQLFRPRNRERISLKLTLLDNAVSKLPISVIVEQGIWLTSYFITSTAISVILLFLFLFLWIQQSIRDQSRRNQSVTLDDEEI